MGHQRPQSVGLHLAGWDGNGPDVMTIVCRTPGGVSLIVAGREHLAGHIEVEEH